MNFLAHIYLSFNDSEISLGNFFADHVKGNNYLIFPEKVQKGILLHRAIDTFTDNHPIHKKSCKRLYSQYRHYSRVIVDIYYDHFLAVAWRQYSTVDLYPFTLDFYQLLQDNYPLLPTKTKTMMPFMIKDNWLFNYQNINGIKAVLEGMDRRTQLKSEMSRAHLDLQRDYHYFQNDFSDFFPELITFSKSKFNDLCDTFS